MRKWLWFRRLVRWLYEWTYQLNTQTGGTLLVKEVFPGGRTKVRYVGDNVKLAKDEFYAAPTGGEVRYIKRGKIAGRRKNPGAVLIADGVDRG